MKDKFITIIILGILFLAIVAFVMRKTYLGELAFSFLPLVFFVLLIGSLALIFLVFKYSKTKLNYFFLGLFLLLISVLAINIFGFYEFNLTETVNAEESEDIEILTVNLWWKNKKYEEMEEFFKEQDADVLLLIEFTDLQYENLTKYLDENYPHTTVVGENLNMPFAGNVVFSKYPIVSHIDHYSNNGYYSGHIETVLDFEGDEYRFLTVHTSAPSTKQNFSNRNEQFGQIYDRTKQGPDIKTIITGDFNLTPWSYYFKDFEDNLEDNYHVVSGQDGMTFSWVSGTLPILRAHIDHTFVSDSVELKDFDSIDFPGSDHDAMLFRL